MSGSSTVAGVDRLESKPSLEEKFDALEGKLRHNLKGKTLLCELVLSSEQCNTIAGALRRLIERDGPARALRQLKERWPMILALWLTHEAFFHFASGRYWPDVLGPIGAGEVGNYSVAVGQAFLEILDRFQLPRFRRIRTRWSYLGPILGHCGIPESCLGEFFEKVVPFASDASGSEGDAFEELQEHLPRMYLSKPTERFLLFGEQIARDFLRRAVNLNRIWETSGTVPEAQLVGLPDRVVDAFREWVKRDTAPRGARRRSFRRPELILHDWQGVQLLLQAQTLSPGERSVRWIVEPDAGDPEMIDMRPDPGDRTVPERDLTLAEPFNSTKVRLLIDEREVAAWALPGVSDERPVFFFDPDTGRLLPEKSVESTAIGIACPPTWQVRVEVDGVERDAALIERRGQLPFGWNDLEARVFDLTDAADLVLRDEQATVRLGIELAEHHAERPRLIAVAGHRLRAADVDGVFVGTPPVLELWKDPSQSTEDFASSWQLEIVPIHAGEEGLPSKRSRLNTCAVEPSPLSCWYRVALDQDAMLGPTAWGEFELKAHGPMGQDAGFRFRVVPAVSASHDWSDDWCGTEPLRVLIRVPDGTVLHGAGFSDQPSSYEIRTDGGRTALSLETVGYGGVRWDLPFDVVVPVPTWALYEPGSKTHLLSWTKSPLRISLAELDGQNPTLLLRLATPWGVPRRAGVLLRGAAGDVFQQEVALDSDGRGRVDLAPLLAAARQRQAARLRLDVEVSLRRTISLHCAEVCREWAPECFSGSVKGEVVVVSWRAQIRVGSRALRADSLVAPWQKACVVGIPDAAQDCWTAPLRELMPEAGIYRLHLGCLDEWTGKFVPATEAEVTIEVGTAADWTRTWEFRDVGPHGYLYRLLLEHYAGVGGNLEVPAIDLETDQHDLALRLLKARASLENRAGNERVRVEIDRFLSKLDVGHVVSAIVDTSEGFDREAMLQSGLLLRPWRQAPRLAGEVGAPALSAADVEGLWRLWRPLGMWADLQLYHNDPGAAENRAIHYLGRDQIAALNPVQIGNKIGLWSDALLHTIRGHIVKVEGERDRSPFDLIRVGAGVEVEVEIDEPEELRGRHCCVARDEARLWTIAAADGEEKGPIELPSRFPGRLSFFFGKNVPALGVPLEGQMIAIIRAGRVNVLQAIQQHCVSLPTSPISAEAYQQASFAWCLRAASDPLVRHDLEERCREFVASFGRSIEETSWAASTSMDWRVQRELRARWHPNAYGEPFFAVPALSWVAAFGMIWRALAKAPPLHLPESEVLDLCLAANRFVPELFEHDLLKVGAIQALDAANTVHP